MSDFHKHTTEITDTHYYFITVADLTKQLTI